MGPNTEFTHELHSLLCMCCKSSSKRTQHCWPTTPNAVGCYMLRPFAHPVACCCVLLGVVAQSLKQVKRLATCKRAQQLPTLLGAVASFLRSLIVTTKLSSIATIFKFVNRSGTPLYVDGVLGNHIKNRFQLN